MFKIELIIENHENLQNKLGYDAATQCLYYGRRAYSRRYSPSQNSC